MGRPKHESRKTGRKGHGQSKYRFRFQSFTERISRNKIDVGHRPGVETVLEDAETFFYQGLQRWIDLKCTEDFSAFTRQVHKVQTLNQLVHHQNLVIDSLKSNLQVRNSLCRCGCANLTQRRPAMMNSSTKFCLHWSLGRAHSW